MEFRRIIEVHHEEFDEIALKKSWVWLNDPEIKSLTITPDLEKENQRRWFESLKSRKDYFVFATWHRDKPIGVGGLKNITDKDAEIYGYIGDKYYWGKAVGIDMMNYCIDYARDILKLESVYSIMLKTNINSYKINKRFGFQNEKVLVDRRIMMRLYL